MEREILFRGKRRDNGEWIYGYVLMDTAPCTLKAKGMCACKHDGSDAFIIAWDDEFHEYSEYQVASSTVGQYTGLKDRNGKKIFEGDIVEAGCKMPVTWDGKFASWCLERKGWAYKHFFGEAVSPEDCEIAGNVWDTPELLEVKK